jgi:hypothetical protein
VSVGFDFDPLPGVVIFELRGAYIAERSVEPPMVVNLVEEVGKIGGYVLECFRNPRGYHGALRFIQVPPMRVERDHIGERIGSIIRLKARLDACLNASAIPVAPSSTFPS